VHCLTIGDDLKRKKFDLLLLVLFSAAAAYTSRVVCSVVKGFIFNDLR
jgi:hypothetical protein